MKALNNYIHVVFNEVVKAFKSRGFETIQTMQEAKDFMKMEFKVKSVSGLSHEECSFFIHEMQDYCWTRLGYYIPDPREPSILLATGDKETGAILIQ